MGMNAYADSMLVSVLNETFEKECGKHQIAKNAADEDSQMAMKVPFSLPVDSTKEEGYRYLEVVYWGPQNYVQVWVRETWNYILVENLEEGEDGELQPKVGKGYHKSASSWTKVADHDSGWRQAMRKILQDNPVTGFSGGSFYKLVPAKTLSFVKSV